MKHTQANAVRVVTGAALPKDGARAVAPNGAAYDQRFIASTELLASDGGIILLDAWRLGGWLQRPRWIANHDLWADSGLGQATLGRGVYAAIEGGLDPARVGPTGRALVVYVRYASTPFAREVQLLYNEGGLDDVSVRWDWQTEELRQPYEEEVALYGEGLSWVATRADLVEVSAVLLGADAGAQIVRSNVLEAVERCVRRGRALPRLTSLIRGEALPDLLSVADTLDAATTAATGLSAWAAAAAPLRQQLADHITHLDNLVMAASNAETNDPPSDLQTAYESLAAALGQFDVALRDVQPTARAIGTALEKLTQAFGLTSTHGRSEAIDLDLDACLADRTLALDMDAVVADTAVERMWQRYKATVAKS